MNVAIKNLYRIHEFMAALVAPQTCLLSFSHLLQSHSPFTRYLINYLHSQQKILDEVFFLLFVEPQKYRRTWKNYDFLTIDVHKFYNN